jgi:hypothetical protein
VVSLTETIFYIKLNVFGETMPSSGVTWNSDESHESMVKGSWQFFVRGVQWDPLLDFS